MLYSLGWLKYPPPSPPLTHCSIPCLSHNFRIPCLYPVVGEFLYDCQTTESKPRRLALASRAISRSPVKPSFRCSITNWVQLDFGQDSPSESPSAAGRFISADIPPAKHLCRKRLRMPGAGLPRADERSAPPTSAPRLSSFSG